MVLAILMVTAILAILIFPFRLRALCPRASFID